ncbi:hypothetical protein GWK48_08260 [Metallosphaera tengchongensis]|uniref:MFS transporter n=1 Tax=Metallosphaera tengchongensis TaxID=1532350 RepID=A0A6N0NVW8_9CREN|nr:hypothetical protein [Metallosphaera tengchongensis]QKR00365.1 hypothetical protein GWK48_08260 [Metallosphaera tengchongensis]
MSDSVKGIKKLLAKKEVMLLTVLRPIILSEVVTGVISYYLFQTGIIHRDLFLQSLVLSYLQPIIYIAQSVRFLGDYIRSPRASWVLLSSISATSLILIGFLVKELSLASLVAALVLLFTTVAPGSIMGTLAFGVFKRVLKEEQEYMALSQIQRAMYISSALVESLLLFLIGLYGVAVITFSFIFLGVYYLIVNIFLALKIDIERTNNGGKGFSISKEALSKYWEILRKNKRYFYGVFLLRIPFVLVSASSLYFYSLFGSSADYYLFASIWNIVGIVGIVAAILTASELMKSLKTLSNGSLVLLMSSICFFVYLIAVYTLKFTPYVYFALLLPIVYIANALIIALNMISDVVVPKEYFGHITSIESVMSLLLSDASLIGIGYLAQNVSVTLSLVIVTLGVVIPSAFVYFKAKDINLINDSSS